VGNVREAASPCSIASPVCFNADLWRYDTSSARGKPEVSRGFDTRRSLEGGLADRFVGHRATMVTNGTIAVGSSLMGVYGRFYLMVGESAQHVMRSVRDTVKVNARRAIYCKRPGAAKFTSSDLFSSRPCYYKVLASPRLNQLSTFWLSPQPEVTTNFLHPIKPHTATSTLFPHLHSHRVRCLHMTSRVFYRLIRRLSSEACGLGKTTNRSGLESGLGGGFARQTPITRPSEMELHTETAVSAVPDTATLTRRSRDLSKSLLALLLTGLKPRGYQPHCFFH
jgi:hypothetical protein